MSTDSAAVDDRANLLLGILLMVFAMAVLNTMDAISKVMTADYASLQVAWGRYFFHLLPMVLLAGPKRIARMARTNHLLAQVIRSGALTVSSVLIILAFAAIPLADAITISFVAPLIMVALGGYFLGERIGIHRWVAVLVGFAGVLIVVWPSGDVLELGALYALGAAGMWAVGQTLTRHVRNDDPWTTLFYTALIGTAATTLAVPFFWQMPDLTGWALMITMGLLGGTAHFLMINAFRNAAASALAPFNYSLMLWAVLYGWLLFDDLPTVRVLAGALVIISAGLYAWHREQAQVGR